jgi:hypothetical protein
VSPDAIAPVRLLRADSPLPAAVAPRPETRTEPVALLLSSAPLPATLVHRIAALPGARIGRLAVGSFTAGTQHLSVIAGDPAFLRSAVPAPTADSDPLWAAVARGDLVETYEGKAAGFGALGVDADVNSGTTTVRMRLGARAGFGLADADFVISPERAEQIGLTGGTGLLVTAAEGTNPAILGQQLAPLATAAKAGYALVGRAAAETTVAGGGTWLGLYQRAASTCSGLPWQVLAAIGQVESDHGRNNGPSSAGAVGPMQFLPSTFAQVAVDADHDGQASPWDPYDAVYSAARLLCRDGAGDPGTLRAAVFAYNHADWYVDEVLALAQRY